MKSLKIMGLIGVGCSALLLTGCGNAHSLTCSKTTGDETQKITLFYNDDETKIESVNVYYDFPIPDGTPDDQVQRVKDSACSNYQSASKCQIKQKGNILSLTVEGLKPEDANLGDDNSTLEEAKKDAIDGGYTCE